MDKHAQAMALLESLPEGWDWSISKHGPWYYVLIRNDGLRHEPFYNSDAISEAALKKKGKVNLDTPERRDILSCVRAAYDAYLKGEAKAA